MRYSEALIKKAAQALPISSVRRAAAIFFASSLNPKRSVANTELFVRNRDKLNQIRTHCQIMEGKVIYNNIAS